MDGWYNYRGNSDQRAFSSKSTLKPPLTLKWQKKIRRGCCVLATSKHLALIKDSFISALDFATGEELWEFKGKRDEFGYAGGHCCGVAGLVLATEKDVRVYDWLTGEIKYSVNRKNLCDNINYASSNGNKFSTGRFFYSIETGEICNEFSKDTGRGSVFDKNYNLRRNGDIETLWALKKGKDKLLWTKDHKDSNSFGSIFSKGIMVCQRPNITFLDVRTGEKLHELNFGSYLQGCVSTKSIIFWKSLERGEDGGQATLLSFDLKTGALLWDETSDYNFEFEQNIRHAEPICNNDYVFASILLCDHEGDVDEGKLFAKEIDTGKTVWEVSVNFEIHQLLMVGKYLIAVAHNRVLCFEQVTGAKFKSKTSQKKKKAPKKRKQKSVRSKK